MRRKIVAGNWKMNGNRQFAEALVARLNPLANELQANVEVIIAPPFVLLSEVLGLASAALKVSSQNVSDFENGAFTGEVSAEMLSDIKCQYSIVGHSERRALFGDSNEVVAKKVARLLGVGVDPIVCVGETLEERDAGNTLAVVKSQLLFALKDLNEQQLKRVVVAYEPVWAIGTGKTATPEQAQDVHAFIRQELAQLNASASEVMPILYGGSVKENNAKELFSMQDIDGGLIGGASLKFEEFAEICKAIG